MKRALAIMVGAALILLLATLTLGVMPYLQMSAEQVPPDLKPYTERQLEGRQIYIANVCVSCHSHQPLHPPSPSAYKNRAWAPPHLPGTYEYITRNLQDPML